jgi:hypothetical protein
MPAKERWYTMSQKKVDKYKDYKKNRRENIKKEKRKERLTMAAMWGAVVVFIACVGGAMGVSIYNNYQAKQAALPTYGSTSFLLSNMASIQKKDTDDQTEAETEAEAESETEEVSSEESSESETSSEEKNETEAAASEASSESETLTQTENEETESESAEN